MAVTSARCFNSEATRCEPTSPVAPVTRTERPGEKVSVISRPGGLADRIRESRCDDVDRVALDDPRAPRGAEALPQRRVVDQPPQRGDPLLVRAHAKTGLTVGDDIRVHSDARGDDRDPRGHVEQRLVAALAPGPGIVRLGEEPDVESIQLRLLAVELEVMHLETPDPWVGVRAAADSHDDVGHRGDPGD